MLSQCKAVRKVTTIYFSWTILRYGPSHIGLRVPTGTSSTRVQDAAMMRKETSAVTEQCHPPGSTAVQNAEDMGGKEELKAPSTLINTSLQRLTFCLVLRSLITPKTKTNPSHADKQLLQTQGRIRMPPSSVQMRLTSTTSKIPNRRMQIP